MQLMEAGWASKAARKALEAAGRDLEVVWRVSKVTRKASEAAGRTSEAAGRASKAAGRHFRGAKNETCLKLEWADLRLKRVNSSLLRFPEAPLGTSEGI